MKPHEEFHLYKTDPAAWSDYAAPRWLDMLVAQRPADRDETWGKAGRLLKTAIAEEAIKRSASMGEESKRDLWLSCPQGLRAEISARIEKKKRKEADGPKPMRRLQVQDALQERQRSLF